MAGRLGLTLTEYRALESGELHIDYELYIRITDLCRWPGGPTRTEDSMGVDGLTQLS